MASVLALGISTSVLYYKKIIDDKSLAYAGSSVTMCMESIKSKEDIKPDRIVVYKDMTMEELTDKLNRTLSSDLSLKGELFANYSVELGVDPYLAVAIAMHETGCTWNCSNLVKSCNNVGGQKGEGCGAYKAYDTLEEGIYGFISNIKRNYVDYGLYTAEEMNPKYAEDPEWSIKVNKYIEKIENN